jgi:SET domain
VIQDPRDSGEGSKILARIKIGQSQNPRYGARCDASRPVSQGEAIVRLSGAMTKQSYRTIQIDEYRHLEEPRILAFLNHSCHPTVLIDTSCLMVFAATDIVAGEELAFFYPSTEWKMVRPFICLCGSAQCLHYIAGAQHLSLNTLDRHFINSHIRDLAMAALCTKSQISRSAKNRAPSEADAR